jgi:hypothetical protein
MWSMSRKEAMTASEEQAAPAGVEEEDLGEKVVVAAAHLALLTLGLVEESHHQPRYIAQLVGPNVQ